MKFRTLRWPALGWAALAAVCILGCEREEVIAVRDATENEISQVVEGNNEFALNIYKQLRLEDETQNLFFSPYSLSTALGMTYTGARSSTAREIANTLRFPFEQDRQLPAMAELIRRQNHLAEKGDFQLSIANALWGQKGFGFSDYFIKKSQAYFGAGLREVDFKNAAEQARVQINSWVEDKTENKIKDLLTPGSLNRMTRLVLTNAIYFKGTWKEQFEESLTRQQPFILVDGTKIQAPLMNRKAAYRYLDQKEFQALEMPYEGEELSMVVLLPKEPDGIYDLEKQLEPQLLQGWIGQLRPVEIIVSFPKFEVTSKFGLSDTFQNMGLTEAFTPEADFSGMLDVKKDLYFDAVVHKAYVKVNEEGTEAAAATGVVMRTTQAVQRPLVFRADHPFLFLIRENRSGSILFMGRVMNPVS